MKKILFVMQSLYNGGAEKSLVNLLNEIPADRYHISLLLFKNEGMFLKHVPKYVHIIKTPIEIKKLFSRINKAGIFMSVKLWGTFKSRWNEKNPSDQAAFRWQNYYSHKISQLKEEFDVAIAYISGEVMYYVAEKVKAKRKLVWIHNDYRTAGHPKKYDYEYLNMMDAIVSISSRCVEILNEEFPDMTDKIYCIPNLISSAIIRKQANEYYPKEFLKNEYNILSIGRLDKQKGFDMAITAASIMKKAGIKFKWFVVGNGDLKKALSLQIKQEDVTECFKLIGVRENPYPYIKNCSFFVQTSRFEGKSMVLDEAKIMCVPIVVTSYPTVGDQIIDGKEGMVVEMSPEGIARGIIYLIENQTYSENLKKYLCSHNYGNENEVKKYIDLIEGV